MENEIDYLKGIDKIDISGKKNKNTPIGKWREEEPETYRLVQAWFDQYKERSIPVFTEMLKDLYFRNLRLHKQISLLNDRIGNLEK